MLRTFCHWNKIHILCVWLMIEWSLEPYKNEAHYSRGEVAWEGSHLKGNHFKAGSGFWLLSTCAWSDIHFQVLVPNAEWGSVGMFKICFGVDRTNNGMFSGGIISAFQHLLVLIHVSRQSSHPVFLSSPFLPGHWKLKRDYTWSQFWLSRWHWS